ncbi:MAG: hypothetical protein J6M01_02035 [Prevotella sp.]|nr:hypothetical protein [Prevotella sp.]
MSSSAKAPPAPTMRTATPGSVPCDTKYWRATSCTEPMGVSGPASSARPPWATAVSSCCRSRFRFIRLKHCSEGKPAATPSNESLTRGFRQR